MRAPPPAARIHRPASALPAGYEADIIQGLREQVIDFEIVKLATAEDRLAAVENGTVDAAIGGAWARGRVRGWMQGGVAGCQVPALGPILCERTMPVACAWLAAHCRPLPPHMPPTRAPYPAPPPCAAVSFTADRLARIDVVRPFYYSGRRRTVCAGRPGGGRVQLD